MTDYRVIDKANAYEKSYIGVVFLRNEKLKVDISLLKWIWLTIVELVVGAELIESIITTGSVLPHENIKKNDSLKYGVESHLTLHIPSGLITNLLRPHIIELLYYKFYCQYLILLPVGEPCINDEQRTIDCTRVRFRARKSVFYQFIALRRVYDSSWLIFNLSIDITVYHFSNSIEWTLISALSVEAIRRLLKV